MLKLYDISASERLSNRVKEHLAGGVHYNFHVKDQRVPVYFSRAKGNRLWDIDGNEYLDLAGKSGSLILGHNHPAYVAVLTECLGTVSAVDHVEIEYHVSKMLSEYIPCCDMVRFSLSGTEAIQNALRLARGYTNKNTILKFEGHYHGSADNIMAHYADADGVPVQEDTGIYSTKGRDPSVLFNQLLILPWNDPLKFKQVIAEKNNEIAAVIAEPICMSGGGIMPQDGFLREIQETCERNGIVFILDETITGLRLGLGGAQELFGITPDLCILGKALGGGSLPISCICGKRALMEMYQEAAVVHAGTFNGYPLAMAAVYATLCALSANEGIYQRMKALAMNMHDAIRLAAQRFDVDLVIQGVACCAVMHNAADEIRQYSDYDEKRMARDALLQKCMQRYGICLASNTKIYPSISLNEDDLFFFEQRLGAVFNLFANIARKYKV